MSQVHLIRRDGAVIGIAESDAQGIAVLQWFHRIATRLRAGLGPHLVEEIRIAASFN